MDAQFNESLRDYYNQHFPHQLVYKWLDYKDGGKNSFKHREFSFTLPGDIYIRYQAFEDSYSFRQELLRKVPIKIDIGAIYNMSPRLYRQYPEDVKPQQRELVFDIDISDYDDVRTCCRESNICDKCWPFMKVGAKILHKILTQEFGFRHLLFVYSGRRGFHCWVSDKVARDLGPDARRAIADYFTVIVGGMSMVKRVTLNPYNGIHPMISKSLEIIDEHFDDIMVNKQDFLANQQLVQNVLDLCEDRILQQRLNDFKLSRLPSADCWNTIKRLTTSHKPPVKRRANYYIEEVKLQHLFPRLDANVTKGFNHLLKLPFCIHPKTGNVCVPIDIENIDKFELDQVPNLKTLTIESLTPAIKIMKKYVDGLAECN